MEANFFKKYKNQIVKIAIFSIVILLLYRLISNLPTTMEFIGKFFEIIKPFIFAGMLAYLLYFPSNYLEKKVFKNIKSPTFSKILSIGVVCIVFLVVVSIFLAYLIPIIFNSLTEIIKNIPEYIESINNYIHSIPADSFLGNFKTDSVMEKLDILTSENLKIEIENYFNLERVLGYTNRAINSIKSIVKLVLVFIISIYILFDREELTIYFKRFLKARTQKKNYMKILTSIRTANNIFSKYIVSQFTDAFVVGVIMIIALLSLDVKYGVLLGFLIGLFNLIPFIGALTAGILAVALTLITSGPVLAFKAGIVILILQQVDANIIQPKIVGTQLKISRILVIAATTIGGAYFGVWGMFFGVPVLTTIKALIDKSTNNKIRENKVKRLLDKKICIKLKKKDNKTIEGTTIRKIKV